MTDITTKYIFVTGGVSSSLGKGIIAASLAKLLQAQGYRTTIQKLDKSQNWESLLCSSTHLYCKITIKARTVFFWLILCGMYSNL